MMHRSTRPLQKTRLTALLVTLFFVALLLASCPLIEDAPWYRDFDSLAPSGNTSPGGIWSDGETMWVADFEDDKIYAYRMRNKTRVAQDFDTLKDAGNTSPGGLWSDGRTMWVVNNVFGDTANDKIYAYNMRGKTRNAARDFDTLMDAGNTAPVGIWSDNITMWVSNNDPNDTADDKIYAYRMSDMSRDPARDFDTLDVAGNNSPKGIWSNGITMWVADFRDIKLYAYKMSDKTRDPAKDFATQMPDGSPPYIPLVLLGSSSPSNIWSDGTTMWVVDNAFDYGGSKIYAYNMSDMSYIACNPCSKHPDEFSVP